MWQWGAQRLQRVPSACAQITSSTVLRLIQPCLWPSLQQSAHKHLNRFQQLINLSCQSKTRVDVVVWPESAFPWMIDGHENLGHLFSQIPATWVVFGADRFEKLPDGMQYFNSLWVFCHDTCKIHAFYDKRHLVPFGEYIPFVYGNLLFPQSFSSGKTHTLNQKYSMASLPTFLPLVCYEIIFSCPQEVQGAAWIVNLTNDAWFKNADGPRQHFAHAVARAVEYGVPVVRVANHGTSAVINAYGVVMDEISLFSRGYKDVKLPKPIPPTFYVRYGSIIWWIMLCSVAIQWIFYRIQRKFFMGDNVL